MEIRIAESSDRDAILDFDKVTEVDASCIAFIERSIASGHCYIAIVDTHPVGYGVLNYSFYENGLVAMLYVHKQYRRSGIGSALMQHMETDCRTPKLFTSTNQSNSQMQALLKKLDYQPSGIIENLDARDPELVYFKYVNEENMTE